MKSDEQGQIHVDGYFWEDSLFQLNSFSELNFVITNWRPMSHKGLQKMKAYTKEEAAHKVSVDLLFSTDSSIVSSKV